VNEENLQAEEEPAEKPAKGEFRVTGDRRFRGHEPGSVFTAQVNPAIERALARGSITDESAVKSDLESKSREELNSHAAILGVEDPAGLANKAAVISAIRDKEKE